MIIGLFVFVITNIKKLSDAGVLIATGTDVGNIVIDKERVQFGNKTFESVSIYHIESNKIKKVYFIQ